MGASLATNIASLCISGMHEFANSILVFTKYSQKLFCVVIKACDDFKIDDVHRCEYDRCE